MPTYPNLPSDVELRLRAVETAAKDVPNYLDTPECPYSEGLRAMLRKMLYGGLGSGMGGEDLRALAEDRVFEVPEGDKFDVVLSEIEDTIEEMKAVERQVRVDGDSEASDRIALVRAKVALLEKWMSLKERVFNTREMSQFQTTVISIMDDVLTVDQRSEFRDRLRFLNGGTGEGGERGVTE